MFKLVFRSDDSPVLGLLKRFRLYHPSLDYLNELSEEGEKSIAVRSQEYSCLMEQILINGIWKRTGVKRLFDIDRWVLDFFNPKSTKINILDIGGSDGSTTYDSLSYFRNKLGCEIEATIIELNLRLYCYRKGFLRYYLTKDFNPLFIQLGIIGILLEETSNREGILFNPIIRLIKKFLIRFNVDKYFDKCDDIIFKNPIVNKSSEIKWLEQSVFEYNPTIENCFNFIRCSNILNVGYFEYSKICQAIDFLIKYLKPNGLLLISRTVDISSGVMQTASLWRKSGGKMVHVSDLNGGSEIKNNVPV
jgi:hypothetical protein